MQGSSSHLRKRRTLFFLTCRFCRTWRVGAYKGYCQGSLFHAIRVSLIPNRHRKHTEAWLTLPFAALLHLMLNFMPDSFSNLSSDYKRWGKHFEFYHMVWANSWLSRFCHLLSSRPLRQLTKSANYTICIIIVALTLWDCWRF